MERLDYSSLMAKRINKILLICNNYDSYSLEEDGHIEAQIAQEYAFYDSSHFARSYYIVTGLRPSDVRKAAKQTDFEKKQDP